MRAKYFEKNNGNMAGYAEHRAKHNMNLMQRKLSKVKHPKARKELEKQMSFQAQKTLINDIGDENRITESLMQERETIKNQVLAAEITGMKSAADQDQYDIAVGKRLADLQESTNNGLIDPKRAVKIRASILDDSANMRARAMVEGNDLKGALKFTTTARFGTESQRRRTIDYISSKHLSGRKKAYEAEKMANDIKRERIEAQTYAIDQEVNSIMNNDSLSTEQKMAQTKSLTMRYKGTLTSKQTRIIRNASYEESRDAVSSALAQVNSIPYDETNTRVFKESMNRMRAIISNDNYPAKVRKEASNALAKIVKKQRTHETLVEKKAYDPLRKSRSLLDKMTHKKIVDKMADTPEYDNLPVEAEVAIYKLYAEGKDKKFISALGKTVKTEGDEPFVLKADKALEIHNKDPEKFEKLIKRAIKRNKSSLSTEELNRAFKQFKTSFDDYKDKVENFEKKEKAILDKYKGL